MSIHLNCTLLIALVKQPYAICIIYRISRYYKTIPIQ
ncbi:hypothetical protein Tsp_04370 [Trichinella spiralis]|nr:hypothetical protein Tsp_04370 [Trichinella spiralis]